MLVSHIPNKPLIEQFNRKARHDIACLFEEKLHVPLPQRKQYYKTTDNRFLVFLSHNGLVVHLYKKNQAIGFAHDHLLAPLHTSYVKSAGTFMGLLPGIERVKERDISYEAYGVGAAGLRVFDEHNDNWGRLPKEKHLLYLDLDPNRVKQMSFMTVKNMFNASSPQTRYYKSFVDLSASLGKTKNQHKQLQIYKKMMNLSIYYKADGRLLSEWDNHDYKGTSEVAANYKQSYVPEILTV